MQDPEFIYKPSTSDIAHHEAAHAVMAILLFDNLDRVTIIADESDGRKTHGRTWVDLPTPTLEIPNGDNFIFYLKAVLFFVSGFYFQKKISGYRDVAGAQDDMKGLDYFTRGLDTSGAIYNAFQVYQPRFMYEFCELPAVITMVGDVAEALLEKKELTGEEVRKLVAKIPIKTQAILEGLKEKYSRNFLKSITEYVAPAEK